MLEIRIHGRGGQGAVVASQILSYAFFLEGRYSQSFPTFGAERRGAPVAAFVRVSEEFIDLRSQVVQPNHVIVLSAKLAETVDVTAGIQPDGLVLINSDKPPDAFAFLEGDCRILTANVGRIAVKHGLGNRIMPMVNAPILGAFAGVSRAVAVDSLLQALPRFIPANLEGNQKALEEAFEEARLMN
jgi:pyruvate ferredoxin oxidoreductase gamma subunit/2-oxoisovalerate ferredoxin oxidoreductase gamma subunit